MWAREDDSGSQRDLQGDGRCQQIMCTHELCWFRVSGVYGVLDLSTRQLCITAIFPRVLESVSALFPSHVTSATRRVRRLSRDRRCEDNHRHHIDSKDTRAVGRHLGLCAELGTDYRPDFDDAPRSGAVLERGLIHDSTRARAFAMCAACFTSTSATPWEMAAIG